MPQNQNNLLSAIRTGDAIKIKELINKNVDVNQFDILNDDYTPLMLAIKLKYADIVKILLEADANLHDSTYFEDNPLGLATTNGDLEIVKLLLGAGANPDIGGESPPICNAIRGKYIDVIKVLIQWNADINLTTPSGITPLMIAAVNGNLEIVEILLEEGANPDATDSNGNTALNKAAYFGHQEVFDYLFLFTSNLKRKELAQQELKIGIIRKQRNNDIEHNKFIDAACFGDVETVVRAIKNGVQINFYDSDGETALHYASKCGHLSIVQMLIKVGADLEIKSEDSGETPLLVAVSALFLAKLKQGFEPDVIKVIKFLINAGADVNAQGKDGNTALSLAKEIGNTEIVQLLLDAGAKDNQLGS